MFTQGNWKIEIDEEKTREYYASLPSVDTQSARNFMKISELFTEEEREFFDTFCIDITKLDVEGNLDLSPVFRKKEKWNCYAHIYYYGTVLSAPLEKLISLEDDSEAFDDSDLFSVTVGRFEFAIQDPEHWEADESSPEGALYIEMSSIGEFDWLLDEKCNETNPREIALFSEIKWKLHWLLFGIREERQVKRQQTAAVIRYFKELGIDLTPISHKQMLEYKAEWVRNYTDDPKIAQVALPSRQIHNMLWHVFSYDEGKATEGDDSQIAFDNVDKKKAVIYIDYIDKAFTANNVCRLKSADLERLCADDDINANLDIVITADDFSWTYCRTHEIPLLGPYFYKKPTE